MWIAKFASIKGRNAIKSIEIVKKLVHKKREEKNHPLVWIWTIFHVFLYLMGWQGLKGGSEQKKNAMRRKNSTLLYFRIEFPCNQDFWKYWDTDKRGPSNGTSSSLLHASPFRIFIIVLNILLQAFRVIGEISWNKINRRGLFLAVLHRSIRTLGLYSYVKVILEFAGISIRFYSY